MTNGMMKVHEQMKMVISFLDLKMEWWWFVIFMDLKMINVSRLV